MPLAISLVLLVALATLDLQGMDPAVLKRALLVPGLGLLLGASALRRRPVRLAPLDGVLLSMVLWSLASSARAPFPGRLPEAGLHLGLAAGAYWLARRELSREDVEGLLAWVFLVTSASMLIELVVAPPWTIHTGGFRAEELVGCLANPNLGASCLLLGLPAAAGRWGRGALVAGGAALVGSMSRGGWVGALGMLLLWGWGTRGDTGRTRTPPSPGRWLLPVLGGLLALFGLATLSGRLRPAHLLEARPLRARVALARIFLEAARERPLSGWGPGSAGVAFRHVTSLRGLPPSLPDRVEYAHNPFLHRAVETGVPGLLLLLVAAGLGLGLLGRELRGSRPRAALGLAGVLLAEQFGVGLETPVIHSLVALTLGALVGADPGEPGSRTTLDGADPGGADPGGGPPGGGPPGGTARSPEAPPPARSPVAGFLALSLLAGAPLAVRLAVAERLRRAVRGQGPSGEAVVLPRESVDRHPSPEYRYDSAGAVALDRDLELGRARYLVLESRYPDYGAARENRRSIREYQEGRSR